MSRILDRLVVAITLAIVLGSLLGSMASGWSAGNSCGSSSYKICVSKDDGNGVPRATTNYSDASYVGDQYYNTTFNIDNSVSSMQNWYSNKDVTFHHDVNNGGTAMCVDSLYGYVSISIVHDDKFSSHQLGGDDGAC